MSYIVYKLFQRLPDGGLGSLFFSPPVVYPVGEWSAPPHPALAFATLDDALEYARQMCIQGLTWLECWRCATDGMKPVYHLLELCDVFSSAPARAQLEQFWSERVWESPNPLAWPFDNLILAPRGTVACWTIYPVCRVSIR